MVDKSVIAIIPARGGSKGIKEKCLVMLGDKPLIVYSIIHAKNIPEISDVYVSTDDKKISELAREYGAKIILRPKELAMDDVPIIPVISHAIKLIDPRPEIVVILQPTNPFRNVETTRIIIGSLGDNDYLLSVHESRDHPYKSYVISNQLLHPLFPDESRLQRQHLPKLYTINATYFLAKTLALLKNPETIKGRIVPLIIEGKECTDIDTYDDLKKARENYEY